MKFVFSFRNYEAMNCFQSLAQDIVAGNLPTWLADGEVDIVNVKDATQLGDDVNYWSNFFAVDVDRNIPALLDSVAPLQWAMSKCKLALIEADEDTPEDDLDIYPYYAQFSTASPLATVTCFYPSSVDTLVFFCSGQDLGIKLILHKLFDIDLSELKIVDFGQDVSCRERDAVVVFHNEGSF